jgi:hypothetical protein
MNTPDFKSVVLAWALAIGGSQASAGDCKPDSLGYQGGIFSSTCATTLSSPAQPFVTQASFSRARVAGSEDTGSLDMKNLTPAVQWVHQAALAHLDKIIRDIGGSRIKSETPVVNISGVVTASASPDTNIKPKTLKRTAGNWSAAVALYEATPENIITAQKRCAALLAMLPTKIENSGSTVEITTKRLTCKPEVKLLNIDTWSAPLKKVWIELIRSGVVNSDLDDAEITTIMLANGTNPSIIGLSLESQETIRKLTKELQAMRVIDIKGSLTASVMINKTEYNWTNIGISIAALLMIAGLIYARGKNSGRKTSYSAA